MQVIPSLFLHIYELVLIIKLVKYIYPKYNNVTYIIFKWRKIEKKNNIHVEKNSREWILIRWEKVRVVINMSKIKL